MSIDKLEARKFKISYIEMFFILLMGKMSIGTYMMFNSVDEYNKKLVVLYEPEFSIAKKDGYN